ncbi:hypothetical protein LSM04_002655 [Trypanosoma melophagium]|uniref:uncharacterized protein n=1 Tax=Trypanosoma melophagium TaxID=715481 RepID=UPI00351A03FF|nr:hypothetical protein LSM04_002655 [Trypanosoma melophagium]
MLGSAIPVRVLDTHVLDLWVFKVSGTSDLDFVLCDVAASEGDRLVDYSWLDPSVRPRFHKNDTDSNRVGALVRWIECCYTKKCTNELPDLLGEYSKSLEFEYDAVLRSIGEGGKRHVEGLAQPIGSGAHITLNIPLLLKDEESTHRRLSNIIELYAKLLDRPLDVVPRFSRVELSLLITCATTARNTTVEVLSERIVMHVDEDKNGHQANFAPFIHSCINFQGLPRYAATMQHGASFMDYIPELETVLRDSINEPIHFLSIVLGVSSSFGKPVSISISMSDIESNGDSNDIKRKNSSRGGCPASEALPARSAVFCVADNETQFGFSILMRYHDGWTLPSIGIIANQYPGGTSQESTLKAKLQYPDEVRQLEKKSRLDGRMEVTSVCDAIVKISLDTMSSLITRGQ